MKRNHLIKIALVMLCIIIVSAGCSTEKREPNLQESVGQGQEEPSGGGTSDQNQKKNLEQDQNKEESAGQKGDSSSQEEEVFAVSSWQVNDSSYENIDNFLKSRKEVQQTKWSPDRHLVAFSVGNMDWDDQMLLWEAGKKAPVMIPDVKDRICGFSLSPDNRYVLADAGSSIQRSGILVDVDSQIKIDDIGYVGEAFWSPDSRWIAVGQLSKIQPSVAIELSGTVDMCIYPVQTREIVVLAQGTADFYYLPEKWDKDGVLTYVKRNFKDPGKRETITYNHKTEALGK